MNSGFRVGSLFDIEITIDPSWIFIFLLVTWNLAIGVFPRLQPEWSTMLYWIIGISASLLFFASVLAHELAHSLVAKAKGLPIKRITLFLFGGVSNLEREPGSPGTEFLMAVVGPITSIVLGFLFLFLSGGVFINLMNSAAVPEGFVSQLSPFQTLLLWLGPINILVGLFNLIPGFPLDGGRVLRSIIWSITNNLKVATRIASFIGQLFGYLFILTGLSMVFGVSVPIFGTGLSGLWIALIGWFLSSAAGQSYQQLALRSSLENVAVKDLMRNKITTVSPYLKVSQLIDKYMIGTDKHAFPVTTEGKLEGMVCLEDIQKIPREEWDKKEIKQVMTPYKDLDLVKPQEEVSQALDKIIRRDIGQIPVIANSRLVGMISRRDILLWFSLHSKDEELKGFTKDI